MRIALRILWYSIGTIALLITIIVGGLTIIEKIRAMCGTFYRDFIAFRLWRTSKRVLDFMKRTHPATYLQSGRNRHGIEAHFSQDMGCP